MLPDHPCFRCVLPDCDESSRRCALRRAFNLANVRAVQGLPLSEREKLARTEMNLTYRLARVVGTQERGGSPS